MAVRSRMPQRGFTLVELMVSLVLFSVAVAGVLSVAVTMSTAFRDQRALGQTENSARSPMDYLTDVLRNASPGVQSGAITDGYAASASAICLAPQAIVVSNNYLGTAPPALATDTLEVIFASGAFVTSAEAAWDNTVATLPVRDSSGFSTGDYLVLTNLNTGILLKVTGITGPSTLQISPVTCTTNIPTGGGYPNGSLVIRAQHGKFFIDPSFDANGTPGLMMMQDPNAATVGPTQPLADGVEDMQVAVAVDNNPADGQITEVGVVAGDDEWYFNVGGETMPVGPLPIRAIRVTLIARGVFTNAVSTTVNSFFRPKAEDHAAGAGDNIRRRVLQSTVEIRNLQGSP
jgi:prepilin-type N-terminal cleavage/methylation domain-containing protein